MMHATNATNLADILERVLDKGIVIAGDIKIQIADIDLLTIKNKALDCFGGQGHGDGDQLVANGFLSFLQSSGVGERGEDQET